MLEQKEILVVCRKKYSKEWA